MKIIKEISISEIKEMAPKIFGNMVKAVVDIEKKEIALDAELHADLEQILLENGSKQKDLWGINFYPDFFGDEDFLEFDSMINIRPSQNNNSRGVEDEKTQQAIISIIKQAIKS